VTRAKVKLSSLLVAGVAATTLLSGCGTHPGSAAVVGGERITTAQVDDAAAALCSSTVSAAKAQGQPRPDLPSRGARSAAIQLLLDNELSRQYGEANGIRVDNRAVSAAMEQSAQQINLLPQPERAQFRELFRGFQESQSILDQAGTASLAEQGNANPSPEEASAEGMRLRNQWAAEQGIEVDVDPRFGEFTNGSITPKNGSLSIAASDRARQGASEEPGAAWTAGLPMSQKC
jgi:hypothetical protein